MRSERPEVIAIASEDAAVGDYAIRLCRCVAQPERIGNYLCRLPTGGTGSRAVTPQQALRFASVQAAEAGLAEHLSGLPLECWDAVYEVVPLDLGERNGE